MERACACARARGKCDQALRILTRMYAAGYSPDRSSGAQQPFIIIAIVTTVWSSPLESLRIHYVPEDGGIVWGKDSNTIWTT